MIQRSAKWLMSHNHPVSHWEHLPAVTIEKDNNLEQAGRPVTPQEILFSWNVAILKKWEQDRLSQTLVPYQDTESSESTYSADVEATPATECIRFTDGRSMDWKNITIHHINYMEKITLHV
jgi:hypothetical protein